VIADSDGGAGVGGAVPLVMHLLSSSNGMMLGPIGGVVSMALLEVAVVRLICQILAPLDSRLPHRVILPWALYTVTSVLLKVTVQLALQKTHMLRRLLTKLGMIVPVDVPGGSHGMLMVALEDDCCSCPVAVLIVDGAAL
jgi:hypothetical protein